MKGDERGDISAYYEQEGVAEKYRYATADGLDDRERDAIERYFTDSNARVLDVGCGTGRTTKSLDAMGFETVGIDLTEPFVEEARSVVPDADFSAGDARSLPFGDEAFQYVLFSYNGIDDIAPEEDRHQVLREVHRVLNPGGVFVFGSRNRWSTYVPSSFDLAGARQYVEFWARNLRRGRLGSRYKLDNAVEDGPELRHFVRPAAQKRQLRNCGFEVLRVVRTGGPLGRYFHHPYYVVQKPDPGGT